MKLEQNDKSMLFSNTEIPDVFFTEYISHANGDYIKVYLYLVFLSKYNKEAKINDLSKFLVLDVKTIQNAINYWENLGIIIKKVNGYGLKSLQEIELHKLYAPKVALSAEMVADSSKNQYRAKAIESINNIYFQGVMSPSWYGDIDLWFKKYKFDEQVMIALFDYCFKRSALHKNYVQAVADAWAKNKITTFTELENYYQKQEKLSIIKKDITKKLGRYNTPISQFEEAYIEKWTVDYNYSLDIINIALRKTVSKSNPSFEYLDKLISDWKERGLKTVSDIEDYLKEFKEKNKNIKELEKKTNYNNYNQRQYKDLNNLYANN